MGRLSDYAVQELIDHLFNAAYSTGGTIYLCLCTAVPSGSTMNEHPDSANYSRKAISFGVPGAVTSRRIIQDALVTFDAASSDWSTITHWALATSATHGGGNMLAYGGFASSFAPITGNTPSIATSQIYVSITATSGVGIVTATAHSLLGLMFDATAFATTAGSTYVALCTADLDDDDAVSANITEPTANGYARELVDANGGTSPTWSASSVTTEVASVSNAAAVVIGPPTGSWGAITAMCVLDAVTGGNVLTYYNAIATQTPNTPDTVQFAIGDLVASLT